MVHVKKEQQQKEQQELGNIFLKQKKIELTISGTLSWKLAAALKAGLSLWLKGCCCGHIQAQNKPSGKAPRIPLLIN